ncbi:hypothetical protein OCL06_15965 [Alteromonas sp. ASW11-19]|uniref:Uncharacterized protein n=1 Tax=Alteromonas salexigens TaxID=2982530 RepID=A0ABT2VT41_9ALTE|nr:hypothetical protein [Alteromonas salexigens]MCU7556088.1 hypothetical protein [Alteromonas salexigens]
MNTVFSLVYFEASKKASNLLNVTNGPSLYQSEREAQAALLAYIRNRLAEAYTDLLAEEAASYGVNIMQYTDNNDEPMTSDEAFHMLMCEKEKLNFSVLTAWFRDVANDDEMYFDFKIEELPTTSFIELATSADAIEVDGNFIRHFHVVSADELEDDHSIYIEASMVDDDLNKYDYDISLSEAQNATYCPVKKLWTVGELDVSFICFQ